MALTAYQTQVESLLDDFNNVEYTAANLTTYINDARVQIAGASESIRRECSLALTSAEQSYAFAAATKFATGVAGLLSVRMARLQTEGGFSRLEMRSWEWFNSYCLCKPVTPTGAPKTCAELQPGINGELYFYPTPDIDYTAFLNGVCYPIALVDNTSVEALSYPWTEAVQYYSAYLALLNAQRSADANAMFARYKEFEMRATQMSTPSRLPRQYAGGAGARGAGMNMPITAPPQGQGR